MADPWDIPPLPTKGNRTAKSIWTAVGRALSEWEELELYLARLYASFVGVPPIKAISRRRYKGAAVFGARAKVIEKAGERYFIKHPDQALEGEFERFMREVRQLAFRRNDIAHGVLRLHWDHRISFSEAVDRMDYMLTPATYMAKKFGPMRKPVYLFRSVDINRFARHFRDYRRRLERLLVQL